MNKKKILVILRRAVLLLLIATLFVCVSKVLERKTVYGAWNYSLKVNGFTNEPEDSMDIIGYGSSHMYCTLNPVSIYEDFGLRSYVLATQQQPVTATYYYIKESLETQSPEVIVLEALMFTVLNDKVSEGIAHDAVDPFPDGWNKLMMIHDLNTVDGKENYYFNLIKYHSRWKEIGKEDIDFSWKKKTDPTHGYVFLTDSNPNSLYQISYENVEEEAILPQFEETFLDIVELAKQKDTEVLLLVAPYNITEAELGRYKYLSRIAQENGVKVLDMNLELDATGLNNDTDYYDPGHLNAYGAEKASTYIVNYIKDNYDITPNDVDDDALWQEDIQYYHETMQE